MCRLMRRDQRVISIGLVFSVAVGVCMFVYLFASKSDFSCFFFVDTEYRRRSTDSWEVRRFGRRVCDECEDDPPGPWPVQC